MSDKVRKFVGKIYRYCGKLLNSMKRFWIFWMISIPSGRFPENLENFRIVWRISGESGKRSRQSGRFPDSLGCIMTVWNISGQSGRFPDSLKIS